MSFNISRLIYSGNKQKAIIGKEYYFSNILPTSDKDLNIVGEKGILTKIEYIDGAIYFEKDNKYSVPYIFSIEDSAEEMFKKLGYEKTLNKKGNILAYTKVTNEKENNTEDSIIFDLEEKQVGFYSVIQNEYSYLNLDLDTMKSINKQIEELGW